MTREIVLLCRCDVGGDDHLDEAQTFTVDVGRGAREIDLCELHRKQLLDPLVEVITAYGVRPAKTQNTPTQIERRKSEGWPKRMKPDDYPCMFCSQTFNQVQPFTRHVQANHGFPEAPMTKIIGTVCPDCGASSPILGQHIRQTHGTSTGRLFRDAWAAGDPHGIVKQLRAAATNVSLP